MSVTMLDSELLMQFRDPATKEKAYTAIIRKYQWTTVLAHSPDEVEHEDANDVLQKCVYKGCGMDWKTSGKTPNYTPGCTDCHNFMNASRTWNNWKKKFGVAQRCGKRTREQDQGRQTLRPQ